MKNKIDLCEQTHISLDTWFGTKMPWQGNREKMILPINGAGSKAYPRRKNNYVDPHLTLYIKISSIWMTNLNVKDNTPKLLEQNIEHFCDFEIGESFLDRT